MDLYHVRFLIFPKSPKFIEATVEGAIARTYVNAANSENAEELTKMRLNDLGWEVSEVELVELFNVNKFDQNEHVPEVVQKAMDGKLAVDIEYW